MSSIQERMRKRQQEIAERSQESARFNDPHSSEYRPQYNTSNSSQQNNRQDDISTVKDSLEQLQQITQNMMSDLGDRAIENKKAIQEALGNTTIQERSTSFINMEAERARLQADYDKASQSMTPQELAAKLKIDPEAQKDPAFITNLKDERKVTTVNKPDANTVVEEPKIVPKLLNRATLAKLEGKIKERVFGQDEVVDEVVNVLKSAFVSLKVNKKKPAGSYFFAGPSGVGKTELARTLAEALDVPMLVINMGEYAQEYEISKLLGAPPGYLGHEQGGVIPNFIEKNPRGIILFDEVEKAHATADNILLSIMDQGVCQDNKGKDVHFKETIIISTSNLGAHVEYATNLTQEEKNEERMRAIKENLRPEIIGRYDSIFHFHSLKPSIYLQIVDKFLKGITKSAKEEHNLTLNFSETVHNLIAEKSYDPALGGRPASKFIEKVVVLPLADFMLRDDFDEQFAKNPEITIDLNEKGNIFFRGNNDSVLGELQDTAGVIQRIENNRFTNKKPNAQFKLDPADEQISVPLVSFRDKAQVSPTPAPAPVKTTRRKPKAG